MTIRLIFVLALLIFASNESEAATLVSKACNNCSASRMHTAARSLAVSNEQRHVYVVNPATQQVRAYWVVVNLEEDPLTGEPKPRTASFEIQPDPVAKAQLLNALNAAITWSNNYTDEVDLGDIPYGCGYSMPQSGYEFALRDDALTGIVESALTCYYRLNLAAFLYVWGNEFTGGLLRTWLVDFTFRTDTWIQINFPDGNTSVMAQVVSTYTDSSGRIFVVVRIDSTTLSDNGVLIPTDPEQLNYLDWDQLSIISPELTARMADHAANMGVPVLLNGSSYTGGAPSLSCHSELRDNRLIVTCRPN